MASITPYLAPAATLIVGLSVAFIAWQQWSVSRNRLKLDLFDRRYRVFDTTRRFLVVIAQHSTFRDAQLFEFYGGISDASFLFGSDVVDYLAQIRTRANDMQMHHDVFEHLPAGPERFRHVEAHKDQLLWLGDQLTVMTEAFAPYLSFSHIK